MFFSDRRVSVQADKIGRSRWRDVITNHSIDPRLDAQVQLSMCVAYDC